MGRSVYLLFHFHETCSEEPRVASVHSIVIMFKSLFMFSLLVIRARVALINITHWKSLSLGSPVLWQKSLFKIFLQTPGLPSLNAMTFSVQALRLLLGQGPSAFPSFLYFCWT